MKKSLLALLLMLPLSVMAQTTQKVLYVQVTRSSGSIVEQALSAEDEYSHPAINFDTKRISANNTSMLLSRIKAIRFAVKEEEIVTEIDKVENATPTAESPAYNLSGQRVNAKQKGIYIIKGKKYIVK